MTGIERLHKLIADIDVSADPKLWYILRWGAEGGWYCAERDGKTLGSTLAAIADQIDREQGEHVSRMRVLAVVTDMERHVSGVEGAEDSPVARWARELREALGGDGRDPATDVSVSAYDLLPQEDREAIAWVREHGGLEEVDAIWDNDVPLAEAVISELWPDGRPDECGNDDVMGELRRRLMPEGVEWPRYESGELVNLGDRYECWCGKTHVVSSVSVRKGCSVLNASDEAHTFVVSNGPLTSHDKRVRRPAPKVYDADGAEIREGDRVWSTHLDEPHEWIVINPHEDRGDSQTVLVSIGDRTGHARPSDLTHQRPDTWQRIEEDAGCTATKYNERRGTIFTTKQQVARDLIRRCRALAERERGE